jgi:putative DNA methylase
MVAITGEVDAGTEVASAAELRTGPRHFLLHHGSAAALPLPAGSVDHVVTDPPYFDSVQYSDLAGFFRAWLAQLLPEAAGWDYDARASAVDIEGDAHYARVLGTIFAECRRVLKPETGRLIFTFHHWRAAAWSALTLALRAGGFRLAEHAVVHAENPTSVHVVNLRALLHDAVLVCRPRAAALGRPWPRPGRIDRGDSETFCRDCAATLGWLLDAERSDAEIEAEWRRLLP